jgi:hypothetical protein
MGVSGQRHAPAALLPPGKGVGPRAGLDTEVRWKILCPCRGSNPDRPVVQPVVRHYTAWALHGAISQTSIIFILAAVRTWNLTQGKLVYFKCFHYMVRLIRINYNLICNFHKYILAIRWMLVLHSKNQTLSKSTKWVKIHFYSWHHLQLGYNFRLKPHTYICIAVA